MHLSQLPSGKWRVAVKHQGRRATGTASTRGAARLLGAELLLRLGQTSGYADDTTVADMLHAHLADRQAHWSPTFHHDAVTVVDRLEHEQPGFVGRSLRDVTPAVLLGLYRELDRTGWSRWRVRRLHTVLGTAWKMAITYEWTSTNPCALVTPPTPDRPDLTLPTDDEVAAILRHVTGVDLLALRLNATLGIRRGDLVGIQWGDVHLDRAELLIARSIAWTPGAGRHVMPTKSGERSHRRLSLDLPTVALLRRWRVEQAEQAVGAGMVSPVWVISDDGGVTPWLPGRVSRMFRRVADRAGVHGVRLHDLRHYVATSMLNDGEPLHEVAGQLGNTIPTTESRYRHWTAGRGKESVDRRAARLDGG